MKPLRVGNVGFTNAEPYRLVAPSFPVEWVNVDPSELTRRIAAGALDCALLPTGALPQLGQEVGALGPYGIACRGRVLSLRLFSHLPIAQLPQPGRSIYITPRTTTTRLLLSELFAMEFGQRPRLVEHPEGADAALLIGDEAMDLNRPEFRWPVSRDMSEWWFEQTGLPFVFAQWTVLASVTPEQKALLRAWIEDNLRVAGTAAGRAACVRAGERSGWSSAMAALYFDRLEYRLSSEHLAGLERFQSLLAAGSAR